MEKFYCPVRLPAWLWNLEFFLKIGIQKLLSYSCESCVIIRVDTSFSCNFPRFWTTCLHGWCAFSVFCGQAEIKQTPNPPIKSRIMETFYCPVRISRLWKLNFAPNNWNPTSVELFLHILRQTQVGISFWCNFLHFWTRGSLFWYVFCIWRFPRKRAQILGL